MKFSILGSGSAGNSTYIETCDNRFLIDAGFSAKKIEERLSIIGVEASTLSAILITHEHGDHILGAGVLSRKYKIPIYITQKSYEVAKKRLGKIDEHLIKYIERTFYLSEHTHITPFDVMHDAIQTIGFNVQDRQESKLSIATDIGYATNVVKECFRNSDAIIIESNYDPEMLLTGPYPWDVKERVKSKRGHFSNECSAKFIESVYTKNLREIFLAHISKDNNTHRLAHKTVTEYLQSVGINQEIKVSVQDIATNLVEI